MEENDKTKYDYFLTIYRRDYLGLPAEIPKLVKFKPEYPDILAGPHQDVLLPESVRQASENPDNYEPYEEYRKKLLQKCPKLERHLAKPLDEGVLEREYQNRRRSAYMIDFCRIDDGFESERTLARRRVKLPDDWGPTPQTTQRCGYRDLRRIATWDIHQKPFPPPKPSLDPNMKEREILKVKTGKSEYGGVIGTLGEEIIAGQFHGQPKVYDNEILPNKQPL